MQLDFEQEDSSLIFDQESEGKDIGLEETEANNEAAMASFLTEKNTMADFDQIKQDLEVSGRSDTIDKILTVAEQDDAMFLREAIEDTMLDPTLSTEEKGRRLETATVMAGEEVSVSVWKEYKNAIIFEHDGKDPETTRIQDARWIELENYNKATEQIHEMKLGILNNLDDPDEGGVVDFLTDIADGALPFNYADTMQKLHTHMYGGEYGVTGYIAIGEITSKLKESFSKMTDPEEMYDWSERMITFFKNNDAFLKDSNGLEAMFTIEMLLNDRYTAGEDFDWDRLIDNVIGFLDLTLVGSVVKSGKYVGRALGITNAANHPAARRISASVVAHPDPEIAKIANQSKDSVVRAGHFPSSSSKHLDGAPSAVIEAIKEADDAMKGMLSKFIAENPTQAQIIKDLASSYGGGKIKVNDTYVTHLSDTEKELQVIVGRSNTGGFSSINNAAKSANLRGITDDLIMYKRGPAGTLELVEEGTSLSKKGEYFYSFKRTENLQPESPLNLTDVHLTPLKGESTRNLYDVSSMFNSKTSGKFLGIEDKKYGHLAQVQRSALGNLRALPEEGQANVLSYIGVGSEQKKTFSYAEATAGTDTLKPMTDAEYVALSNIRSASDLTHRTDNQFLKNWLEVNNYKAIIGNDDVLLYGVKTTRAEVESINGVIDVATGQARTLTPEMKSNIELGTSEIYTLRSKEYRNGDKLRYMYVGEGNKRNVRDIPNEPLPYIDGYVHRRYSDDLYIERIDPSITTNGGMKSTIRDQRSVVGSAVKRTDAEKLLARYTDELITPEEKLAGVTYQIRHGREVISDLETGAAAYELAAMNGLLHKGTRGAILGSIEARHQGIVPILDSIKSSMNKAASNMSTRVFVENTEKQFVKEFGGKDGLLRVDDRGVSVFPTHRDQIPKNPLVKDDIKHKRMVAAWEYINYLGRFEDPVTQGWRATVRTFANFLDSKGLQGTKATALLKGSIKRDPLDILKGATFTAFLAVNPVRQLVVQLSQHLMLSAISPKYFASGKVYSDTGTLLAGAAMRHKKQLWKQHKAKLAEIRGISVKEYTKEVDDWMNSGLPSGVDHHNFLDGMLFNKTELVGTTGAQRGATMVGNVWNAPFRFVRKAGFNAGEVGNLALTYHIARKRLPKGTAADLIAEDARNMSFGMNRPGELKHQRGKWKVLTQFYSMQQKGALIILSALTNGKAGNRFFTPSEARRLAGVQVMFFGAQGVGVGMLANELIDMYQEATGDEVGNEVREVVTAGVGTYMLNSLLTEIDGGDRRTRVDFTSVAALSGSTMMMRSIFDLAGRTNEDTWVKFTGASGSLINRVVQEAAAADRILAFPNPEMDNEERVLLAMQRLMSIGSGVNNYFKGAIAAREGYFTNRHGSPTVRATATEAYAKMLFGFGSYNENTYWRVKGNYEEELRYWKSESDSMIKALNTIYQDNKHEDMSLLAERLEGVTMWMHLLEPEMREGIRDLMVDKLLSQAQTQVGQDILINRMLKGDYPLEKFKGSMKDLSNGDVWGELIDMLATNPEIDLEAIEEEEGND